MTYKVRLVQEKPRNLSCCGFEQGDMDRIVDVKKKLMTVVEREIIKKFCCSGSGCYYEIY